MKVGQKSITRAQIFAVCHCPPRSVHAWHFHPTVPVDKASRRCLGSFRVGGKKGLFCKPVALIGNIEYRKPLC